MAARKRGGGLNADEKRIVKALLAEGMRNQDIQACKYWPHSDDK